MCAQGFPGHPRHARQPRAQPVLRAETAADGFSPCCHEQSSDECLQPVKGDIPSSPSRLGLMIEHNVYVTIHMPQK